MGRTDHMNRNRCVYCPVRVLNTLSANWIVVEAALAMCVAPVAAVASFARTRGYGRWLLRFSSSIAVGVVICGAVGRLAFTAAAWSTIVEAQIVVASAALAAGALGVFASVMFSDVLDAAGSSLAVTLLCSSGVFLVGGPLADVSTGVLNAALLASPIVSAASAADIDVFRSAFLYEHSPVAHRLFAYPAWSSAAGLYLLVAAIVFAAASRLPAARR